MAPAAIARTNKSSCFPPSRRPIRTNKRIKLQSQGEKVGTVKGKQKEKKKYRVHGHLISGGHLQLGSKI